MPAWQIATAAAITLIVAITTHVFYRRPPAALWPWLPLCFGFALLFALGDLVANLWAGNPRALWCGMAMLYTGLLGISVAWWSFSSAFARMNGYGGKWAGFGFRTLVVLDVLLWFGMITNPSHGHFVELNPGSRSNYGPLWYGMAAINYASMMAAMGLHLRGSFVCADRTIRSQCRFLAFAAAVPTTFNLIYVTSPSPLAYDPTALGFALSCVLFLYAVDRRSLFVLENVSLPSVLDADTDAVVIVSPQLRVLFVNSVANGLFAKGSLRPGVAMDELLAQVLPSFRFSNALAAIPGEPGPEHRFLGRGGDDRWIALDVSPVYRGRRELAGHCLRLRDRTPLRRARERVEEHASVLEAVVHGSGEGLLVQSSSGEIRYVNEAFAAIWKVPLATIKLWDRCIPRYVGKMLVEQPPVRFTEAWHRDRAAFDRKFEDTCDLQLSDGRIVEAQTFPIDASHGIEGRVWRIADVTQRRNDALAMIHSQKLEGLGVLAGGIAHDFNNLLVAVLANAELARKELPGSSLAHGLLADVESAAVRASELTGQLLAYAGKTNFDREDLDISVLVREVSELLMVSVPKGIEVDFGLDGDLDLVRAGAAEIRQVVMNLVTNAADSIGDDGGRVWIETGRGEPPPMEHAEAFAEHGAKPERAVFLRVADTGTGMDRRTLERIFDPFFTTKFTGRGLGLAATLGILDTHGAALKIETALGVGSAFTLMLPALEDRFLSNVPFGNEPEDFHFGGLRVLVVDDEPSVRSVLQKTLGAEGLDVEQASSGEDALGVLKAGEALPDLVILDLTMPGLGGIETLDRIRDEHPGLPVLLSSGYPEEALDVIREKGGRLNGFIQKPYRKAHLLEEIEKLLRGARHDGRDPW